MSTRRVAGLLGLVALVLIIVSNVLTGSAGGDPEVGGPVAEYARELAENPPGTAFWAGAYLEVLGFVAFLFYFPALWAVLRRSAGELEWLAVAALGAGLVATAVKLASRGRIWPHDNSVRDRDDLRHWQELGRNGDLACARFSVVRPAAQPRSVPAGLSRRPESPRQRVLLRGASDDSGSALRGWRRTTSELRQYIHDQPVTKQRGMV